MTAIQRGVSPRPAVDETRSNPEGHVDIGAEDVRQGQTTGHMRWVLVISTFTAAVLFVALWLWYPRPAMKASPPQSAAASAPAAAPGPTGSNPATQ
jgi:hypothetical protein